MKDIFFAIAVLVIIFYAGINYLKIFNVNINLPTELEQSYNAAYQNIQETQKIVTENIKQGESAGLFGNVPLIGDIFRAMSVAFGFINLIAVSLWSVFISIPSAVFISANYIASVLSIPKEIVLVSEAVLIALVVLKTVEFITGRYMR